MPLVRGGPCHVRNAHHRCVVYGPLIRHRPGIHADALSLVEIATMWEEIFGVSALLNRSVGGFHTNVQGLRPKRHNLHGPRAADHFGVAPPHRAVDTIQILAPSPRIESDPCREQQSDVKILIGIGTR